MFISSKIEKINETSYKLTIKYSYFGLYYYDEVFVYSSLDEARNKLLDERCYDKLVVNV